MEQKNAKTIGADLTQGSILRLLITFAVPIILTNLVQQVYSMVDLIIIGQYVGSVGTVGVSTGGELSDLMTPLATAIATAGQIYIAQLAGAKDDKRIREAAGTMITTMLIISLVFTLLTLVFYRQILTFLNCPQEAFAEAASYMLITAIGMPFIFGYNAVCALLRGLGEAKRPLIFIIVAAVINIFLDLLLVAIFKLDAAGTAIATVASQVGAFAASFYYLYRRREQFDFSFSRNFFRIHANHLRIIMILGVPQLVRVICVQSAMLWVKAGINSYGLVASATYSVGNKIEKFVNIFVQGVDGAGGAMIGQNIGAKKNHRVRKIVLTELATCLVIGLCIAAIFLLVPRPLYSIFTTDSAVIEYGIVFLRIMSLACITSSMAAAFKSIATGSGAVQLCFFIGILDGVCRVLVCLFFLYILGCGADSYFWGAALCQVVPGIICALYFFSGKWERLKLLSER